MSVWYSTDGKFKVQTRFTGEWIDADWLIHEGPSSFPERFDSVPEAEEAIKEQIRECEATSASPLELDPANYRVVPVEG